MKRIWVYILLMVMVAGCVGKGNELSSDGGSGNVVDTVVIPEQGGEAVASEVDDDEVKTLLVTDKVEFKDMTDIEVQASEDGCLRAFSWDDSMGGTQRYYNNVNPNPFHIHNFYKFQLLDKYNILPPPSQIHFTLLTPLPIQKKTATPLSGHCSYCILLSKRGYPFQRSSVSQSAGNPISFMLTSLFLLPISSFIDSTNLLLGSITSNK